MPDPALYDAVADQLRAGFSLFHAVPSRNEAAIRHCVISPVLDAIGYSNPYRIPEQGAGPNRPDDLCYTTPDFAGHAALIIEAKYNQPFDKAPGGESARSPDRQIQRYLRQHPASGPNTIGVLTDGVRWRIYERIGASTDVRFLSEYDFTPIIEQQVAMPVPDADPDGLREFVDRLCRECVIERSGAPSRRRPKPSLAALLLGAFDDANPEPEDILPHLLGGVMAEVHYDLADHLRLEGVRLDAVERNWDGYAYALGASVQLPQSAQPTQSTLEGRRVAAAAVRFAPEIRALSRADTASCARTFARVGGANAAVVLAYRYTDDGGIEARLAACTGGATAMTAPFDPGLPTAAARTAIEGVFGVLADNRELAPDRLLAPLEVAPLRQQFYAEVSAWTKRMAIGRDAVGREAVLRHLIRVMFAWILKEDALIPAELFERGFAASRLRNLNRYHRDVLRDLFHHRLNVEEPMRDPHPDPAINEAMEAVHFLNGSLFQEQEGDSELDIPAAAYWSEAGESPGLFTIFSRYHWTTNEHRPGESEQTLDPELLSNMFERLILVVEDDMEDGQRDRQPHGTYYTPSDVVTEMVKDALTAAVRSHAPARVANEQLLSLFSDRSASLPSMSSGERAALANRIHELRIFDPAVGSGAFLFGCLIALQTALRKLEPDSADPTLEIIREQLHGQDIHPLAAQITRLRLFIALKAAEGASKAVDVVGEHTAPLPNLEARIVCADTIETRADPGWRPDQPGQLDTANSELVRALTAVAESRGRWLEAHTESEKQQVLRLNDERRSTLRELLRGMGDLASPELRNFADTPILPNPSYPADRKAARTDARLLFYENPWRGFDIVIGNPPYEAPRESMDETRIKALGDQTTGKRYQTTNCGDLYTLFCEVALALAKPEGGVVTMIVPLSIAFGQRERTLREVFARCSASINLRHYDNRPDTTFNASPTVRSPENRQRATIVTAVRGGTSDCEIQSTGLQRWHANERSYCMEQRKSAIAPRLGLRVDSRLALQWPRTPTPEVASFVSVALGQDATVGDYIVASGVRMAIPKTAYQFLAALPEGSVKPRSETAFAVRSTDARYQLMAVLNTNVAHGWWAIFGDGFHVNLHEVTTLPIPDAWASDPGPAISLGKRLVAAIPDSIVENKQQGGVWRNVDFHTYAPGLVAEADRLYIEALGLPVEPLLSHLRIMRSNRSWDFS